MKQTNTLLFSKKKEIKIKLVRKKSKLTTEMETLTFERRRPKEFAGTRDKEALHATSGSGLPFPLLA